jgi:hypothetical protein
MLPACVPHVRTWTVDGAKRSDVKLAHLLKMLSDVCGLMYTKCNYSREETYGNGYQL